MVRHTPRWRVFKRMQWSVLASGALLYAAVTVHAWQVLDLPTAHKQLTMLLLPLTHAGVCAVVPLTVPPLSRMLKRYVWLSFAAGFGQSVTSVLTGLGVLTLAAGLIWWQIEGVSDGGRAPGGIFSAYGAGLGVLLAQALLCFRLEQEPQVRRIIEEP